MSKCQPCHGGGKLYGAFGDSWDCIPCRGTGQRRTGPYRLTDCTWSDGVDRDEPLSVWTLPNGRWQVYRCESGYWEAYAETDGRQLDEIDSFPTHAEAIAYADRMARTNQGETMSKTFKSVIGKSDSRRVHIESRPEGPNVWISDNSWGDDYGITLAPSDAPALALAILEAAGFKAEFHATGTFQDGDCWQLENVAQVIKDYLSIKDAEAAEAKDKAKLKAEALELFNEYRVATQLTPIVSWDEAHPLAQEQWLAVARKAREFGGGGE